MRVLAAALCVLLCAHLVACEKGNFAFMTVGDWGGVDLGGYHATNAIATAAAMGQLGTTWNASFIVNVGDNFYYNGVTSTTDKQWKDDWTNTFTAQSLQVPWYSVLGNHDYAGSPEAQINYPYDKRWVMPARSYLERIYSPWAGEYVSFVFWDSNPCISYWRADDPSGWDPSTPQFHANIIAQDCTTIQTWLQTTLAGITDRWIIVVSHVPPHEVDLFDATALYQQYGVSLALAGHTHLLEYYTLTNNNVNYVISGAACMVYPEDESASQAQAKNTTVKLPAVDNEQDGEGLLGSSQGPQPNEVFRQKITGLTVHDFSADGNQLTTRFFSSNPVAEIYTFVSYPQNTNEARLARAAGKPNKK
jgi:hypothetical protein